MEQHLHCEGSGNVIVQNAGDNVQIHIESTAKLELIDPSVRFSGVEQRGEATFLSPFLRSIPFVGRRMDLDDLHRWLESPRTISARTIVGAAGSGKTRIAIELIHNASTSAEKKWDA